MVKRGRIGKKQRALMNKHVLELLRGKSYPLEQQPIVIDKANMGAGILGSKLILHTHTDHHYKHLLF